MTNRHAWQNWEGKSDCSENANVVDIAIVESALVDRECDDLIANDDMEARIEYWSQTYSPTGNNNPTVARRISGVATEDNGFP